MTEYPKRYKNIPSVKLDTCVSCGAIVEVPGRDLCFDCYSEAEGRGD